MEELDLLKKAWQKDTHSFEQVSENDIYKMLHRKSSSIVKWILIISILEFIFWNVINMFVGDSYIREKYGKEIYEYFTDISFVYNIVNYTVVGIFIYLFYRNYKRISITTSTKKLMQDILRVRKTVNYYVWFNIVIFMAGLLVILYVEFNYDSKFTGVMRRIHNDAGYTEMCKIFGILLVLLAIVVVLFWLFYKLIYGILLGKLNKNYKELKKIDL